MHSSTLVLRRSVAAIGTIRGGLSNPEIADRLYISRRTVEHHVAAGFESVEIAHIEADIGNSYYIARLSPPS